MNKDLERLTFIQLQEFSIKHYTLVNADNLEFLHGKLNSLITVEGNIAAGKSTFLEFLKYDCNIAVLAEPLSEWRCDELGRNLLDLYYKNPYLYGAQFQNHVVKTLANQINSVQRPKTTLITERCTKSAINIFTKSMQSAGILNDTEVAHLGTYEATTVIREPVLHVYIYTSPETAFRRMSNRQRSEENKVTLQYLVDLHQRHNQWLLTQTKTPVLLINGDLAPLDNFNTVAKLLIDSINGYK